MRKFLTILLVLLTSALTLAQDATGTPDAEPSPFRQALALIPDTALVRGANILFSYADYHAALEARAIERPERLADYIEDREAVGPIFAALPQTGPANLIIYLLNGGPDYPATVGFDFFEVAQAVEIGEPPERGQILLGDFSADAVEAAFTARDYAIERQDESGVLLCPEAGCDAGMQINFDNINHGNPFGGDLGRTEPIFTADGVLLDSPHFPLLEAMAAVYADSGASLADAPEFQAVANVLDEYPYVLSVNALSPLMLGTIDPVSIEEGQVQLSDGVIAQLESAPVQPYQIAVIASTADDTNEYGLALLVYVNAEAAQQAAASIDQRLVAMSSFRQPTRTYAEILNDAGTLEPSTVLTDDATGLSVVVVRVTDALPLNEPDNLGMIPGSHIPFRRFYEMVISRDSNWLVWGTAE